MATSDRKEIRDRIHTRIRKRSGTAERPVSRHFSGKHVYAQVIDDEAGRTLVAAGTTEKVLGEQGKSRQSRDGGKGRKGNCGTFAREKVDKVIFDRGGFLYHGKVKALADAAREGGLKF